MSTTLQVANELVTHLAAEDKFLDTVDEKLRRINTLIRVGASIGASVVPLIAYLVWRTIGKTIVAGLTAVLGLFFVFNVTDLEKQVDNEWNGAPVVRIEPGRPGIGEPEVGGPRA